MYYERWALFSFLFLKIHTDALDRHWITYSSSKLVRISKNDYKWSTISRNSLKLWSTYFSFKLLAQIWRLFWWLFGSSIQSSSCLLTNERLTRATQRGGSIHLDSLSSFKKTLHLTQDRIVSHVGHRVDTFFEDAQYNWETSRSPPANGEPSNYLIDLTEFLSTVMMSVLIQLPDGAKDYVYRGALTHCANVLKVSGILNLWKIS